MAQRKGGPGANLVYSTDADPGLTRVRHGRSFAYRRPGGRPVRDQATLRRIASLAIPPAWENVWICLQPRRPRSQAVPLPPEVDARARRRQVLATAGLLQGPAQDPPPRGQRPPPARTRA